MVFRQTNPLSPATEPGRLEDIPSPDEDLNLLIGRDALEKGLKSDQLREAMECYGKLLDRCDDLPPRSAFNPAALPRHLPTIFLVEHEAHPDLGHDYRYRVFGTALAIMFGEDMTGKLVSEFHSPNRAVRTRRILDLALSEKCMFRSAGEFITRNGMPVFGEALIMPFGEDGQVTHILADLDYDAPA